ncbi:hypothetical protein EXIGLDRAFT_681537 [Exidia glandulosa HHB12029]|uniref:Tyrosine specific protein phosphatases domain-containing protein n=1 Tax=Exidia glandulosa HHB12029 TaxID=1314781 RepID=A0A165E046_EXIGL|nr:hypothetical protein EXIGLDRAFT_681537 [Exidia glandulosa HHB12029]
MSVDVAALAALPSPPFVQIEGVLNARALDTVLSTSGSLVPMRIVRAGEVARITPQGQDQLRALGVKRIFDLRSNTEKEKAPTPSIDGVEVYSAAIFDWYTPEQMKSIFLSLESDQLKGFMDRYKQMLDNGASGYGAILEHVRDRPQDGFLVHCSAGKDRTGVIVAVLLSLAGVTDEAIVEDYAMTRLGLAPYEALIATRFADKEEWRAHPEGGRRLLSAEPATMTEFLRVLRDQYGGAEGYCAKLGFSAEDIARIKANLVTRDMR